MMTAATLEVPRLREELSLHCGPASLDGSPTWTIRDPVRNRYFRIGWSAFEALSRWQGTASEVINRVRAETTLDIDEDDIGELAQFLASNQLIQSSSHGDTLRLTQRAAAEQESRLQWLLHHYLFFRIPLLRPDRFLAHLVPLVSWLGSAWFGWITLGALGVGLMLVVRQWDLFNATLVETLSLEGLLSYAVALSAVKVVHELAHGLVAKSFGCRVPTMGVAFLVMWPVLYTDVNEVWTLQSRRQRLQVGAAGIASELAVAAWATLAWAFLPEGPLRQGAFILATITWVSSVAINMSPFMRFDGYYLAMDALEMPNLHQRSFAMARWWLREALFSLREPMPEESGDGRRLAMILFAFTVWIYRLVLFLGIAVLVYHFFIKAVGVLLFAVEIGWFVVLPFVHELREWAKRRASIMRSKRWRLPLLGLGLAVLMVAMPWRTHVEAPAIVAAKTVSPLFLPAPARLERVRVQRGQHVTAGEPLLLFVAPDIAARQRILQARLEGKKAEVEYAQLDPYTRGRLSMLVEEIARLTSEKAALDAEARRLTVTAPHDGQFLDPLPDLTPGAWLSPHQQLGLIRADGQTVAVAYFAEADVARIKEGDEASFIPLGLDHPRMLGAVMSIDRNPAKVITEPALTSVHGGDIPVRAAGQALVPQGGCFRVTIRLVGMPPDLKLTGHVIVSGLSQSILLRLARSTAAILVREWGA